MCSGPVLRKMIVFTLPIMFSGLFQLLFNATDIIVVGRFAGDNALAAVGSNTALINLMTNLFIGISIGANVVAARYCGAKNYSELNRTVHTAMLLSVISGFLLMAAGLLFAEQILGLMSTPESILGMASDYLRLYFCGMPFMMIYNFGNALLRAAGDTRRPLIYLICGGVVNVLLDLLFVIALDMSAAGVGLATAISQGVSAALMVRCLMREKDENGLKLRLKNLRIHKDKLLMILKIGLPAGFQGTVFSLSNVVIQSSINLFGEAVIAGNSAAASIEGFVYMAMNSCYQSTLSFTSANIGAGKYERINKILRCGLLCVVAVWAILGLGVAMTFSRPLLSIYTSGDEAINAGVRRMMYVCGTYFLCGYGRHGWLPARNGLFSYADDSFAARRVRTQTCVARDGVPDGAVPYAGHCVPVLSGFLGDNGRGACYLLLHMPEQAQKEDPAPENGERSGGAVS